MSHLVVPHAQSLCFAVHFRHDQFSHQIHLRWFTSSTKSATIQRRICDRDTIPEGSAQRPAWSMGRLAYSAHHQAYKAKRRSGLGEPLRPRASRI